MKTPHKNCYWVVPGRLLAGEYPGHEDPRKALDKVRAFLDAGITYFIDLTQEDELTPYEQLLIEEAQRRGVRFVYSRRPIVDEAVPGAEQMVRIQDEIQSALDGGHRVYVHCWGGVGRTGTVIGCWLARECGSGEEALTRLDTVWRDMSAEKISRHGRSPSTPAQIAMVRGWAEPAGPRTPWEEPPESTGNRARS